MHCFMFDLKVNIENRITLKVNVVTLSPLYSSKKQKHCGSLFLINFKQLEFGLCTIKFSH